MNGRRDSLGLILVTMVLFAGTSFAAQDAATDVPVARDLTAVIALQGQPCGQVVSVRKQAENDYLATCEDDHRYRVFVNAEGRVVAVKL